MYEFNKYLILKREFHEIFNPQFFRQTITPRLISLLIIKCRRHSSYRMKLFIPLDECMLHFIINNEIINRFWDSVARDHGPALCRISRDLHTKFLQKSSGRCSI
jgi:hypothetical protein